MLKIYFSRKKTKFELQYLNFIDYYINYFEGFLKVPVGCINELQNESEKIINSTLDNSKAINEVSLLARKFLKINDNRNLMYVLEKSGIYILEKKNLGHTIDAYSTFTKDKRSFIILGTYKKSAVRRTFDLAHELGHLLLHRNIDMETLDHDEYRMIEKEANDFASEFLLPKNQFIKDFANINRPSNPLSYIFLKEKYYVSIAALELRAYKLGLINYQQNRYFYSKINKLRYKKVEPLDSQWAPIRPGKIKAMLDIIFENNLLNVSDLSINMHISEKFLINLFDLSNSYFGGL